MCAVVWPNFASGVRIAVECAVMRCLSCGEPHSMEADSHVLYSSQMLLGQADFVVMLADGNGEGFMLRRMFCTPVPDSRVQSFTSTSDANNYSLRLECARADHFQ